MGSIRNTIAAGLRSFAAWIEKTDGAPTQQAGEKRPRSAADDRDVPSEQETHRIRVDEKGAVAPAVREPSVVCTVFSPSGRRVVLTACV